MRQQVHAIGRIGRVRRGAGGGQQCRHPVHVGGDLLADAVARNARGPGDDGRDAQAAFQQFGFAAGEGPGVGEALAAIVAGEDHDGVAGDAVALDRLQHAADLCVHGGDHAAIGFLRAAVEVDRVLAAQALGLGFVTGRLPRPVRRVEMQAEQEGLAGLGVAVDHLHGVAAEQVGGVAGLRHRLVVVPEIRGAGAAGVQVVVDGAAAIAVEMVIAAFQRAEIGQVAEVPLADQGGAVAGLAQQRRQGGVVRWQADALFRAAGQRFLQPDGQAHLVAAGDDGDARGGADRGIGIGLGEAHAARGDAVDVRGLQIRPAVAADIGEAHVVGDDEDDVGLARRGLRRGGAGTECDGPGAGLEHAAAREACLIGHVVSPWYWGPSWRGLRQDGNLGSGADGGA